MQQILNSMAKVLDEIKNKKPKAGSNWRNLVIYFLIILVGSLIIYGFFQPRAAANEKPLSEVLNLLKEGKEKEVLIDGETILVTLKEGGLVQTRMEKNATFVGILSDAGIKPQDVPFKVKDNSASETFFSLLGLLLPVILIGAFFFFIMRQARAQGDSLMSFSRQV
jgi:cell division protease FtsH